MTDRHELAVECLKIEKAGGSVLEFLKGKGCISPWGTWHRLQKEELRRQDWQITEGRGRKMDHFGIKDQVAEAIVREIEAKRDPLAMLTERGYAAASAKYTDTKCWAKKSRPDLYEKFPENLRWWKEQNGIGKTKPEDGQIRYGKATADPVPVIADTKAGAPLISKEDVVAAVKVGGPLKIETKEPEKVGVKAPKISRPLNYGGLDMTAVRDPEGEIGEFYYDTKYKTIDWRTDIGDEVSMTPKCWRKLLKMLPNVLAVLGVDPDE